MEPENNLQNKNIHTLAEDIAGAMEGNDGGLIKKIISEEEFREENQESRAIDTKRNKFFLFSSLILLVLAFGILSLFVNSEKEIEAPPAPVQFTPLIFTEKSSFIEVDPASEDPIYKSILKEFDSSDVKKDGILAVYLTENKKLVELPRFLKIIDANFVISDPKIFGESFLIGMLKNETEYPFLLFKIKSFADIFNDLRLWE